MAVVPVVVGTALAWLSMGRVDPGVALLTLAASILVQLVTNLQNDVGYTTRGAESPNRIGLPRATANGWLRPAQVRAAIVATIVVAGAVASPLLVRQGWPVLAMGAASILAALAYMGGPRPIAYTPLGEVTVLLFFGLVAVCGTFFVQTGSLAPVAWIAGLAVGMLAAAVLVVNNHRDIAHDRDTGRRTLAVTFGSAVSLRVYATLLAVPHALAAVLAWQQSSPWLALPLLAAPSSLRLARRLRDASSPNAYNGVLLATVRLEVLFGMLLAAGAAIEALG